MAQSNGVALLDFQARNPRELSIHKNEPLVIVNDSAYFGQWWKVQNEQGKSGLVPFNCARRDQPVRKQGPPVAKKPKPDARVALYERQAQDQEKRFSVHNTAEDTTKQPNATAESSMNNSYEGVPHRDGRLPAPTAQLQPSKQPSTEHLISTGPCIKERIASLNLGDQHKQMKGNESEGRTHGAEQSVWNIQTPIQKIPHSKQSPQVQPQQPQQTEQDLQTEQQLTELEDLKSQLQQSQQTERDLQAQLQQAEQDYQAQLQKSNQINQDLRELLKQSQQTECNLQTERQQTELEDLQAQLQRSQQTERDLQAQLQQAEKDIQVWLQQIEQDLQSQLQQAERDAQVWLQQAEQDYQAQLQQAEQDHKAQLQKLNQINQDLQEQLKQSQQTKQDLQTKQQQTELKDLQSQLQRSQQTKRDLQAQLQQSQQTKRDLQAQLQQSQQTKRDLQAQLQQSQQTKRDLQAQLQQAIKNHQAQLQKSEQTNQELQEQLKQSQQAERDHQAELQQSNQINQDLREQLMCSQQTEQDLHRKLQDLQLQLQSQASSKELEFWNVPRTDISTVSEIGRGGWGTVFKGTFQGQTVAVKQLYPAIHSKDNIHRLRREVCMMAQVRHPNLLLFIAAVFDDEIERLRKPPLVIMELLDTDLRSAYEKNLVDDSQSKFTILRDVAFGLNYLHNCREPIIHRDVSAPNVLLEALANNRWKAKVSDFGSANLVKFAQTTAEGAILYSAPETLPDEIRDPNVPPEQTPKIDVYSYGVLLCEVITCKLPEPKQFKQMKAEVEQSWPSMYHFIVSCTSRYPDKRPTMAEVVKAMIRMIPVV